MKQNEPFIRHILEEINFIMDKSKNLKYDTLIKDETLKRAFLRSLEVIGEATKNISIDFREKHPEIKWKELTGLRDKLIHKYFGVKWEIVWDMIKDRLPEIKGKMRGILEKGETSVVN